MMPLARDRTLISINIKGKITLSNNNLIIYLKTKAKKNLLEVRLARKSDFLKRFL